MKRSLNRTRCPEQFYDTSDLKRHTLGCKCFSDFADPELGLTWRPLEYILRFDICYALSAPPLLKIITKQCHRLYQNVKVCGKWLKQVVRGHWGLYLTKIWKSLAPLLREINTLFASVFGMSLCNGLVTAIHPGKELAEQHGGNKEEKPRRGKRTWVGFFFFFLTLFYFSFEDSVFKNKNMQSCQATCHPLVNSV